MKQTQTIMQSNILDSVSTLPIFRGMNRDELVINDANGNKVGKGVNYFSALLSLGIVGVIGYFLVVYVLPLVATILGYTLGIIASGALVLFSLAMYPVYKRWLSIFSDKAYRKLIESNPFIILNQKKIEYQKHKATLNLETANLRQLQIESENKAFENEKEAKEHQDEITIYTARAQKLKAQKDKLVAELGEEQAKEEEEFYKLDNEMRKAINDAQRSESLLAQKTKFIGVYGHRGLIFKKLFLTLNNAKMNVDETLKDFELTIKMLEDEYKSADDAKRATQSAKNALGLSSKFEVELAIQIVNNTISKNISETVANLEDIAELTKNINNVNPDEQLERLSSLSDKIDSGTMFIPSSKKFKNIDKKFTQEEKHNLGSFSSLLDN